jgi:hypothetical protein
MSIFKQLAIEKISETFKLPLEISHEILSFSLYNKIEVSRAIHRFYMSEIVFHFENAFIYRKQTNDDTCEHWATCLSLLKDDGYTGEKQFQGTNCKKCGEYKLIGTFGPTEHLMCHCIEIN